MTLTANTQMLVPMMLLLLSASANSQPASPQAATPQSSVAQAFWSGLGQINMLFKAAGSLASGATNGAVWRLDLASGNRQRIGTGDTLSWPVAATGTSPVFALHGRQLVRLGADGTETPAGNDTAWRKLLGVLPDGSVLGFVAGEPRARPALLSPDGSVQGLPPRKATRTASANPSHCRRSGTTRTARACGSAALNVAARASTFS